MAPPTDEDIEWFRSTFRPIPKPQLPDDCIEYSLYCVSTSNVDSTEDADLIRNRLTEVQKAAAELVRAFLKDYIWQRDTFMLEMIREDGLNLLRGRTEYGDSIEDEWVIVYILRELTRQFDDLWVKVSDSDGEFLLVEAAPTLPSWLEPDIANHRVWIHKGRLLIIKPEKDKRSIPKPLTFREARKIIVGDPRRLMHSPTIEAEAFYRLRNYPTQIADNLHTSPITIPRKLAYILHIKPAYISPAVDAFYIRDPISLRPLKSKDTSALIFKPEDLVTVSVRFTRVGYAQLKSQDFELPPAWKGKLPPETPKLNYARAEMGVKVTSGFEMLLSDPQNQDKVAVREIKLILEDIESGDDKLPTNDEIESTWEKREDDEKWLDISFEDLEQELKGRHGADKSAKSAGAFGDQAAQENLQRIVERFEQFLNDDRAGLDGADLIDETDSDDCDVDTDDISSDGEDKEVSFDEDEFSKMMQEMMGLPTKPEGNTRPMMMKRFEELNSDEDEDDNEEIEKLSKQMEAELRATGVFDLNPEGNKKHAIKGKDPTRSREESDSSQEIERNTDDEGDYGVESMDVNLARNLLESFRSQAGSAGPGSNLLGMMGMTLPKDDRESK
ncbi:regulatory factor Sgt1 [Histoplasma capsulatum H143]|uniref:Regulatory factor Sgt1 n=1 Tax=Ajellomyces capsulatus (strain H143) TaxID=544712 RepID=C6H765_AJECH|nr:regulatory factor Sgt1 [Histoplasma capsulatum H143]